MINAYHSIISYQEDEWEEYLEKIALIDIFKPIIEKYEDKNVLKCVIRYVLWVYSVESDMVIIKDDLKLNKTRIFEAAQVMPVKNLYEDLVLLKSKEVLLVINRWLDFQDNDTFRQLVILRELRMEMQMSCLSDIKTASGEINYNQKFANAEFSIQLKTMIKDLESELIQNNVRLKEAVKEVKSASKVKYTVGPENFSK